MQLTDSRRLTGPNLILDGPGAAAEIVVSNTQREYVAALWESYSRRLLDGVGWAEEKSFLRLYDGGATVAISAPIDALYAACEIVEAAWDFTQAEVSGGTLPNYDEVLKGLSREIADEISPDLLTLAEAAHAKNVTLLADDETVTLGLGAKGRSWPRNDIPKASDINWNTIADIPAALVTGTNGKSTTVRIAASIGAAAGLTVGFSSSDWVKAGETIIANGDYSGPEGARLALRDNRVDIAVIETARGGLLRRGLPLSKASACLITNVAADHLGEYGIKDVEALADTKFTISKAVGDSGALILNIDDARLKSRGEAFTGKVLWYGLSLSAKDCSGAEFAGLVHEDILTLYRDGALIPILPVADFGPALGGAASYNVSNALGAIVLMSVLGVSPDHLKQGLLNFESSVEDNPGRGNFMEIGGVKVILDFAHNPHGLSALTQALSSFPAKRRLYLCGQGGDRSDEDIFELTKVICSANPDAIIVKELPGKLRGREIGEVPALIQNYLTQLDYPAEKTLFASDEYEASVKAFEWANPGDLLVLLVYGKRKETLDLIQSLKARNWQVGDPVKA